MATNLNTAYQVRADQYNTSELSELQAEQGVIIYDKDTNSFKGRDNTGFKSFATSADAGLGWADYNDTQYTSGSPLSLTANTNTALLNNAGSTIKTYLPEGVTDLYDVATQKVLGREGDAYIITTEYKAVPTQAGTTYIETWFDIGGAVGELYRQISSFPKGQGQVRNITTSTLVYTLDTWEANGASLFIRSNRTANVYDIRYVIARVYMA